MITTLTSILEWSGCALSILGAYLLACNNDRSRYGFIAFLMANALWLGYAALTKAPGLAVQQIAFTVTSLYGIRTWFSRRPQNPAPPETRTTIQCNE